MLTKMRVQLESLTKVPIAALLLHVALAVACTQPTDADSGSSPATGSVQHALTDTDSDGMDDAWEISHFGNLSQSATADFDADGMTNGEEYQYNFDPKVKDSYDDADGDRYPNVFEIHNSGDPNDAASIPVPTYTVKPAGGGTHTTIRAAVNALDVSAGGPYQIITLAPGVYTSTSNVGVVIADSGAIPKVLIIGAEGAAKTIIDGEGAAQHGFTLSHSCVIASLTFRRLQTALLVNDFLTNLEVRLIDVLMVQNAGDSQAGAIHATTGTAANIQIRNSTFLNNTSASPNQQIWMGATGTLSLVNTAIWGPTSTAATLAIGGSATLTTSYSLVKGLTLTGTGNLAGSTDPKLTSDGHIAWDSPLRGSGGTIAQSRADIDGEPRPVSSPDIGVDQFFDSDADDVADLWEIAHAGNLTTFTGPTQDGDADGFSNEQEYLAGTDPLVADSDSDGLTDGDEVNTQGTDPLKADTDGDDMPDGWEVAHGLSPTIANGFDDPDGDRYPNVFEFAQSSDPLDRASIPSPHYVVDQAGGSGTYPTISAALDQARPAHGAYHIIGIRPGTYTGTSNSSISTSPNYSTVLLIGLGNPNQTIIDGGSNQVGWFVGVGSSMVISSLTFQHTRGAIQVDAAAKNVRLIDLLVHDNAAWPSDTLSAGLNVRGGTVQVSGSDFINNTAPATTAAKQINISGGSATFTNTVVWNATSGGMLAKGASATLSTSYCLVKGQTLTGTGNLDGATDPKVRSDFHLRSDSPLRGAGGGIASRLDIDGELRPTMAPDLGIDQYRDEDADELPDSFEVATYGSISSVSGLDDPDSDELDNTGEYDWETDPHNADTDHDGLYDGVEVAIGTNPLVQDAEDLSSDLNHDGVIDSVGVQLGYQPDQLDDDGDSISNADELLMCTDPLRADTDGDGVPDNTDVFPLDARASALVSDPGDVTPPVITLISPSYAVEQ